MSRVFPMIILALALFLGLTGSRVWAEDKGQADLDKATQRKMDATTAADLSEVIQLCQSALKKGLGKKDDIVFAKDLMASALVQRGMGHAGKALRNLVAAAPQPGGKSGPNEPKTGPGADAGHPPAPGDWKEDRKQALSDLEQGIRLSPNPQALYTIVRLNLLPEGDAKRAAEALDQVIAQSQKEPPLRAEALLLRASRQPDLSKHLADLDEAVRTVPENPIVLRTRGAFRADLEKYGEAIADFDKAIAVEPMQPASYQLKALTLLKQKKLDEALKVFDQAVKLDPRNLNLYVLRGAIYRQTGDKAKALADVDKILELQPQAAGAMRDRAELLADLGKLDAAREQLEQLRKLNPKDPVTLLQLGLVWMATKKYDQAVEAFSAVLADHPDAWAAYRARGDALLNLGRRAQAVADYDRAMTLRPKDIAILNNLAWVLSTAPEKEVRDGQRALGLAVDACKLTDYKQDYILSTLAAAYAESGDFAKAREWASKAVELSTKEHAEALKKELENYKSNKPWREALPEADKKPEDKKPKDKKQEGKKPKDKKHGPESQPKPPVKGP